MTTAPEFSRRVQAASLEPAAETPRHIVADAAERAALATRFGLQGLGLLEADVRLTPKEAGMVHMAVDMRAEVTQTCVVSLEPVEAVIEAHFERLYAPETMDLGALEEEDHDPEEEDLPDPLVGGGLDMGEAVAEQLALELDPFPRAPGAAFEGYTTADPEAEAEMAADTPFAVLAKLKKNPDSGTEGR